jgi:hypothetical protein
MGARLSRKKGSHGKEGFDHSSHCESEGEAGMEYYTIRFGSKTQRVRKDAVGFQRLQSVRASLAATLGGEAQIEDRIKCPPGDDEDEWIAVNSTFRISNMR